MKKIGMAIKINISNFLFWFWFLFFILSASLFCKIKARERFLFDWFFQKIKWNFSYFRFESNQIQMACWRCSLTLDHSFSWKTDPQDEYNWVYELNLLYLSPMLLISLIESQWWVRSTLCAPVIYYQEDKNYWAWKYLFLLRKTIKSSFIKEQYIKRASSVTVINIYSPTKTTR